MTSRYGVIVIGAGPAGAIAAREAARRGCGPVLLLERRSLPRDKPCGGGISPRARRILAELGLWEEVAARAYPICGCRLTSPSGRQILLRGGEAAAVLNRRVFDQLLVEAAVRAGVELRQRSPVQELRVEGGRVCGVSLAGESITAPWVIVANGANSRLSFDLRPRRLLHTCMAWFADVSFTPNVLEMVYDPALVPHYGWLFPEGEHRVNIGICIAAAKLGRRSIRDIFGQFLSRHFSARLAAAKPLGPWRGHPISTTSQVQHDAPPGALVIGEANRLTNAATGEGICYALDSGRLAARAIARHRDPESTRDWFTARLRRAHRPRFLAADFFCWIAPGALDGITRLGSNRIVSRLAGDALGKL